MVPNTDGKIKILLLSAALETMKKIVCVVRRALALTVGDMVDDKSVVSICVCQNM